MAVRPYEERVAELHARREKAKQKAAQYDEQIKRLEKQAAEEARKRRTHALIVCGAEMAALFDKILDQDEIYAVVNFLREQRELGNFSLDEMETPEPEVTQESEEKTKGTDADIFGGFFDF